MKKPTPYKPINFTREEVNAMCDMMDAGMSAASVAAQFGLTRFQLLGMRFRAGRSKSGRRSIEVAAEDTKKKSKPCLKCGSTKPRPKPYRLCKECKSMEIFGGMYGR